MAINYGRVILGGVVAGIVSDIFEAGINGAILAPQWSAIMGALGRPQFGPSATIWFNIVGLVIGLATVWTYAAIRPRFGSGPRTALIAAALIWVTVKVLGVVYPVITGIYPLQPMAIMLAMQVPEIAIAALVGGWLYREPGQG